MKLTTLLRSVTLLSACMLLFQNIVWAEPAENPREERIRQIEQQNSELGKRVRERDFQSRRGQPQQPPATTTPRADAVLAPGGQISADPSYGYSKENPVKLGSPEQFEGATMSKVYLRRLRDNKGQPLRFERIGSVGSGTDSHIIDLYRLTDSSGTEYRIYIDMYHPELNPLTLKAPKGLGITP